MCDPVLAINRVSILVILVSNRVHVWLFHSSLELGMILKEATFSSLSTRPSLKALHKLCLEQLCQMQHS